jgi:hypothetical protein
MPFSSSVFSPKPKVEPWRRWTSTSEKATGSSPYPRPSESDPKTERGISLWVSLINYNQWDHANLIDGEKVSTAMAMTHDEYHGGNDSYAIGGKTHV